MVFSRRDLILKDIVELFIKTGQPVGSNTLIDQYDLPFSSATIRNDMMELESQGMIEKTHTSSGRVPSTAGYKYYVEHLRGNDVNDEIKNQLAVILDAKNKSVEDVIKESCEILSHMTNLASIVLGPSADEEKLVSVQVIPISKNSATAVFVTDKGYVENKTFILSENVDINDLEKCVKLLNERLIGTSISELVPKMDSMKPLIESFVKSHDIIYRAFAEAILKFSTDRVSLFGKENLLEQPEFTSDIEKLRRMIKILETPSLMADFMKEISGETRVLIGKDDLGNGIDDVSVVTAKINLGDHTGTIALVGPTRMDYGKVLSALEYVSQQLDIFFNERREDEK